MSAGFCLSQTEENQYGYLKDILDNLKKKESETPIEGDLALEVAYVYLRIGKFEEAINVLKRELNLHPADDNARLFLAITYFKNHGVQEALIELKKIGKKLEGEKEYEVMRKRMRDFAFSRRATWSGDEIWKPLIGLSKENLGLFYFAYGFVLESIKEFDGAREKFEISAKAGYDERETQRHLIQIFIKQGNMDKAKEGFESLEKMTGKDEKILFQRGYFYNLDGQSEKAIASFKESLTLNPHFAGARKNLA